ncbi:MAG: YciI family protein [Hydrogenophaga sp.]|uniref:YciI family protein n=1 Tax=Hydrogenophaga sp. TaxID=1904254 RepID=UPI003D0FB21D
MRVMVIVKATPSSESGLMPRTEDMAAMGEFNEELMKAGVLVSGDGLHPSVRGKRVRFSGPGRSVIDGPFPQTQELVAGFWIWQVKSLDDAVQWVKRCPNPMPEDSEIEIRPMFEAEDFGEAYTPELRAQEDRLRADLNQAADS